MRKSGGNQCLKKRQEAVQIVLEIRMKSFFVFRIKILILIEIQLTANALAFPNFV